MKRLLSLVAVLLVGTVATAYAFFGAADPRTTDGSANVKIPIHNDSTNSATLDEGDVVIVDMSASTGDNDLYVATTTTADTGLVVGVISSSSIAAGDNGSAIVYGLATCDVGSNGIGENGLLCTSTVAGSGYPCADEADNAYAVALAAAEPNTQVSCWVK